MSDQVISHAIHGTPRVPASAFLAPGARVIGNVELGENVGVWFNAVLRGDSDAIVIGDGSNIQDNVSGHGDPGSPLLVGRNVSVGHNAVIHGCTIQDDCLVGMGAIVMNGAVVGAGSLVAAGALVLEGQQIPAGSLVAGVPAKVRRALTDDEKADILRNAENYRARIAHYRG
jgi:carbonic anhydrase/acetyltransferase-like protein (isoleucine patch superfamily)